MITFKQHPMGFIFMRTSARSRYKIATREFVRQNFPLIFETAKNLDVQKMRKAYMMNAFGEKRIMEGIYDGVYWYNTSNS